MYRNMWKKTHENEKMKKEKLQAFKKEGGGEEETHQETRVIFL